VRTYLNALGVPHEIDPRLVRGLDYYTRTTWEFIGPEEGSQSTISGGGRYDYLVEEIGGPPTPGVGFGAGIERLLSAVQPRTRVRRLDVFIARGPETRSDDVVEVLGRLRNRGISADTDYAGRSGKGQERQMSRLKPKLTLYFGPGVTIRELGHPDEQVPYEDVVERVKERLRR
jgi:histidyl-tRNA synthetase